MGRTSTFLFNFFGKALLFVLLHIYSNCIAQDVYHKIIGTSGDDFGSFYKTETGFYLAGHTTIHGSEDMYFVKLNEHLDVNWSKTYSASSGERAMGIAEKSNGNILISGWGNSGSFSSLLEIDQNGNIVNSTGFGSLHDRLHSIMKTKDGGYLNYGELEGSVPGHNKVALLKYDSNMNMEWLKYYDNTSSSDNSSSFEVYGRQVVQLEDESYAILGSYTEFNNATNNRKIRIIKVDKEGNEVWTKGFHGGKMDNAYHMILCKDEGFLISATSNSYFNYGTDILIIKADKDGELEWYNTFGGQQDELAGQVFEQGNGHFLVSGSTKSFGSKENDYLLFSIDQKGHLRKAHTYGSEGDDILIKLDTISNYYVLSGSSSSFDQPDYNIYLVKTKFNKASSDCSADVTGLLWTSYEPHMYIFNEHYSSGTFQSPANTNLNTSTVSSFELKPCLSCPEGNLKSHVLCPGEGVLSSYENDTVVSVSWYNGSNNVSNYFSEEGTYWVDIETEHCLFRDTILITKEESYDLELGEDKLLCYGETALLDASVPNALNYTWQDGNTDSIYFATESGTYNVEVRTYCAVLSDSIKLIYPTKNELFIPNVITPNDDGFNDKFELSATDFNVQLTILNRWGKEVYFSNSYANNWGGDKLPSGVYYYLAKIGCTNQEYKGWLHILND